MNWSRTKETVSQKGRHSHSNRIKEKRTVSGTIFDICNYAFMMLFAFVCCYPFYYIVIYSLSNPNLASDIVFLPRGFTLRNYLDVIRLDGLGQAALISVGRTVLGTALAVISNSFCAYLMTKRNMPGRKLIYRFLIVTLYLDSGLIPYYLVMRAYGFTNNFLYYIVPGMVSVHNIILIKTYMESIPESLEESARIDGAGYMRCWWNVLMPLCKPILATIATFAAVGQWNSWFDSHIYMTDSKLWSLQYVLYRYLQKAQALADAIRDQSSYELSQLVMTPEAVRMTITALVTLPILFVYPFAQRYFMKGIMMGAVKG